MTHCHEITIFRKFLGHFHRSLKYTSLINLINGIYQFFLRHLGYVLNSLFKKSYYRYEPTNHSRIVSVVGFTYAEK